MLACLAISPVVVMIPDMGEKVKVLLNGKKPDLRKISVVTRNPQFNKLLGRILQDWKFVLVEDLTAATVVFAERGLALPEHGEKVVWLSPMPLAEKNSLQVPLSLTSLYNFLEEKYFLPPRRHIRVAMETVVDLKVGNDWLDGVLTSLSNRGGRITCSQEMPRDMSLQLSVKLGGKTLIIDSEVLYCIPAGDSPGRLQPQIGLLFKFPNSRECEMLRRFIEKNCIESACVRENILLNDPCLSWLDVPGDPWTIAGS